MGNYIIKKECEEGMRYWSYYKKDNHTLQGYWSLPAHKVNQFNYKEIMNYYYFTALLMILSMRVNGTKASIIKKWW